MRAETARVSGSDAHALFEHQHCELPLRPLPVLAEASRRRVLLGAAAQAAWPQAARAAGPPGSDPRARLLAALEQGLGEADVAAAVEALVAQGDPAGGRAAERLDGPLSGEWRLLWGNGQAEPQRIQAALGPLAPVSHGLARIHGKCIRKSKVTNS